MILSILILIILIIYLIFSNTKTESFIHNDPKWKGYRLGDIVQYWNKTKIKNHDWEYINSISHKFPNTIGSIYLKRNPKKQQNLPLLFQIIDEKSRQKNTNNLPKDNEFILHLRIGDSIKDYQDDKFVYLLDKYRTNQPYAIKIENIEKNIKLFKGKKVILLYGNHQHHINKKANELYLQHIRELFAKNNISFEEKASGNPDEDFIYMCNSKLFGQSGGGFSSLIANYVKSKGNKVIDLNSIKTT